MLSQLHAIPDLAADRRRTLLAEAEAERLGRQASAARPPTRRRTRLGVLRLPDAWRPAIRRAGTPDALRDR